jgi:hypothetical protein
LLICSGVVSSEKFCAVEWVHSEVSEQNWVSYLEHKNERAR